MLHDNVGYTPYEGRTVRGWPEVVVSRGRVIVEDGRMHAERGSGQYLPRGTPEPLAAHARRAADGTPSPFFKRLKGMQKDPE